MHCEGRVLRPAAVFPLPGQGGGGVSQSDFLTKEGLMLTGDSRVRNRRPLQRVANWLIPSSTAVATHVLFLKSAITVLHWLHAPFPYTALMTPFPSP